MPAWPGLRPRMADQTGSIPARNRSVKPSSEAWSATSRPICMRQSPGPSVLRRDTGRLPFLANLVNN